MTDAQRKQKRDYYLRHRGRILARIKERAATRKVEKAAYDRRYRMEHMPRRAMLRRQSLERRLPVYRAFRDWLKSLPCADCDVLLIPSQMHFDHVRGPKLEEPSSMFNRRLGLQFIQAELMKCELVCIDCHMDRHYRSERAVA